LRAKIEFDKVMEMLDMAAAVLRKGIVERPKGGIAIAGQGGELHRKKQRLLTPS